MSAGIYGSVNGVTRKAKKLYANVNGVTREIKELYTNVNGVTRKIYQAMPQQISTTYFVYGLDSNPTILNIGGSYQTTFYNGRYDDYAWACPIFDKSFTVTQITLYGWTNIPESSEHNTEYYVYFYSGGSFIVGNALYTDKRTFSETKDGLNMFWDAGAAINHFEVTLKSGDYTSKNYNVEMWAGVTTKEFGTFQVPIS